MIEAEYSTFLRTYNTILRNIGLYISLSLGILAYSRYYRSNEKVQYNYIYNIVGIIVGLVFLSISFSLNCALIKDLSVIDNKNIVTLETFSTWKNLPYVTLCIVVAIFVLNLYTLYRFI